MTVAVIDTGFTVSQSTAGAKLCKYGHKDFTSLNESTSTDKTVTPVPVDNHGHGTNIAGVIQKFAGNANFCIVVLKYYDPKVVGNNLDQTVKAIRYATQIGVKYINYSGGGIEHSEAERAAVKSFLDKGGIFIAAAGNERSDLSKLAYYPAMDDARVTVVGSVEPNGEVAGYSNYGKQVTRWEYGTNQVGFGMSMSGTSQAAAVATGKIIKEQECDK
ncbi:MAG: S8 family serine peptidase [Leptolyngbyaceae cyanobacterium RM2_2_4]|nr:S8 family serine peptidase [Leptolyngbyaceae cyanobacterium RM2_2_4]